MLAASGTSIEGSKCNTQFLHFTIPLITNPRQLSGLLHKTMELIVHFSHFIAQSYKSKQATTVPDFAAVPNSTLLFLSANSLTPFVACTTSSHPQAPRSHSKAADQAQLLAYHTYTARKPHSLLRLGTYTLRHCCPTTTPTSTTHLSKWPNTLRL